MYCPDQGRKNSFFNPFSNPNAENLELRYQKTSSNAENLELR
jgi:hypothetical protein